MLEQIFGSTARTKILKFFCLHLQDKFFIRELSRDLNLQLNSIRRELDNLENFGFLYSEEQPGKKFYFVNQNFSLFTEIKNLVLKSLAVEEMHIAGQMSKIPGLSLLIFTGVLTNAPTSTDVLIVGKVKKKEFGRYLKEIAEGTPEELRYTFLSKQDYLYRLEITDKFIYDIWAHENIVVVDKLSKEIKKKKLDDYNFKHFRE